MNTTTGIIFKKYKILLIFLIIGGYLPSANIYAQGFGGISSFFNITAEITSGDKPQSKVWYNDGIWWAVIPVSSGTYIYHLDVNNNWVQGLQLSSSTTIQADTKNVGNTTYILLFDRQTPANSSLKIVAYNPANTSYSLSTSLSSSLSSTVETATIDIDSNQRIWVAYEASNNINVEWSDSPYSTWNGPIVLKSGVNGQDDIAAVTAFTIGGVSKIGVMWSNQVDQDPGPVIKTRFGFRYRNDDPLTPLESDFFSDEVPGDADALDLTTGNGMADDHINFAVDSRDGTIYAAVKTGYDTQPNPQVALLVRNPTNGVWSFYSVRDRGGFSRQPTRPIALLDEINDVITVVYTQDTGGNDIMYKSSLISSIDFYPSGDGEKLIPNTTNDWDNVTSTKQSFNPDVLILTSSGSSTNPIASQSWRGVIGSEITPTPVELVYFAGNLNGNNIELRWRTETEINNYGFDVERIADNSNWMAIGFVDGNGNSNSPKQYNFIDTDINQSGTYYYRLKQIDNDGTYEYSDVVKVEVGVPNKFYLSQNYPNPFNPETRIDFALPEKQLVTIKIYNTLGEQVTELVNEEREAGSYSVTFDASTLPSGIYIYRLQTSSFVANKKMTLLK